MLDNTFTGEDDFSGNEVNVIEASQFDCPYGDWEIEIPIYEDANSSDVYGFGTHVEMYPGIQECSDGTYENDNLFITHDWSQNDIDGQTVDTNLGDHNPEKDDTGSVSFSGLSISSSGATLTWDYDQPDVTRYDNTTNTPAVGDWDFYFNDGARLDPIELETGTITNFAVAPDSNDILAQAQFEMEFRKSSVGKVYKPEYCIVPSTSTI